MDALTPITAEALLEHRPRLYSFAISLTHDQTRAEDLVQDTLLRAMTHLYQFAPGTEMGAWLFTILRNSHFSFYRKMRRERDWHPGLENSLQHSTGLVAEGASTDYRKMLIFLACLPPDQRDALVAVGYLGLGYDEAAECLGAALGTVKSRVNRARNTLHAMMAGSAEVLSAPLAQLAAAHKAVPGSHKFYPIARAYAEMYAAFAEKEEATPDEDNWQALVASGALDGDDWEDE